MHLSPLFHPNHLWQWVALAPLSAPLKVLFSNKSVSLGSAKVDPQEGAEQ